MPNKASPTNRKQPRSKATPKAKTVPVAVTINTRTARPVIKHLSGGNCRISHREFITDYSALRPDFSVTKIAVNPGLNAIFPWLSGVASRYEYYTFKKLKFVYQPVCPTSTSGSVMLAADYDAADLTPTSKVVLMSFAGAVRTAPWQEVTFDSMAPDRDAFTSKRFIRQGAVGANDVKTYDVCNFFIASVLTPNASTSLGELYVEYDVELITPQLLNSIAANRKSQTTTITVPALGQLAVKLDVRGTDATPIMWPFNYGDFQGNKFVDIIYNGIGNYMLDVARKRVGNLLPAMVVNTPPDVQALMSNPNNHAGSWNIDPSSGLDTEFQGFVAVTNQPYASFSKLLGGGGVTVGDASDNYSTQVLRFFYGDATDQDDLQVGDIVTLALTPIDASLASIVATTRALFAPYGPNFGFPVIIPPTTYNSVAFDGTYTFLYPPQ